ncbi:Protein kinase domain family protein [Babesia bovis T2Bo]|uniref:Protein kinase domain containing protein n=1 Tax=Babesia bovis TaxID=5865 RepID=A7APF0_BABBO|nr:Protein kinase domain family protein [Babesia bovis T2Bo]EDO08434.1 Protein kinase domain family protein [Babesia bovis T2Bo]|eukprot:XP_001612002.1 protein kinase domain containing protein [Babesia bovis T2Bo]
MELKKQESFTNVPLMFVNEDDVNDVYPVPQEYPYRQQPTQSGDSVNDAIYPVLPNKMKTARNTLVSYSPAISDRHLASDVLKRLDSQLSTHVDRAITNVGTDIEPPTKNKNVFLSPEFAKKRRQMLFAKQWKRNAINEYMVKYYASKFQPTEDVSLKQHICNTIGGDHALRNFFELKNGSDHKLRKDETNDMVKDWIEAGPQYSQVLSDALKKYHDYLYKRNRDNSDVKRKVASTSRYFFEMLAEAKECERKMNERMLVTEERLYGRKDFIADIEKENQLNRNRCKKLYAMYLQCQRRCDEWVRNAHVTQNTARNTSQQNTSFYGHQADNRVQIQANADGLAEATAANIAEVPPNNYNMEACNTTAATGAPPATRNRDPHVLHITQSTGTLNDRRDTSERLLANQYEDRGSSVNGNAPSAGIQPSEMPCQTENYNNEVGKNAPNPNQALYSGSWDPLVCRQTEGKRLNQYVVNKRTTSADDTLTPTRRLREVDASISLINPGEVPPDGKTADVDSGDPVTPTQLMSGSVNRVNELQLSNRLSSVGGVNRWIYSKMEERGELDGYKTLLNELRSLLFAKGGTVLGYYSLPQALEWLDETDANRVIIPPSQESFRDGTLYTTCSFAEIKLMKILQGGIYLLRSKPRTKVFDEAVLQQILDANSELFELKKRLDNGRCSLYKKLKRDWAERNSKWAGFPPLKRGYRLLNMLGKGGFAEVWEVLDPITLTIQAAKLHILSNDMNQIERGNVVMRVKNEIDIHKTCRTHKNIVNMKACFEMGDNMLATILELCDDGDLDHYIKLHAPVPEKLALTWTYQILEGLHYMKTLPEGRVHHCDLKPGNILKHKGNIKLADFGLSKMVPHESTRELWGGGGTIFYQPPECLVANVRNKQVVLTDKIDIWAVGCILYEMLYNTRPFGFGGGKKSLSERMYQAILSGVKFPSNDNVSEECKNLMLRFLAFDPSMRPSIEEAMASPIFHMDVGDST